MDHHLGVRQAEPLALGARAEQECTHTGLQADAVRRHVRLDKIHGVINRHAVIDAAARAVDVERDIRLWINVRQVQQLRHHAIGGMLVDLLAEENDPLIEKS